MLPARIPLRGGPTELVKAWVSRVRGTPRFWTAVLRFGNGEEHRVPLYVDCRSRDEGQEKTAAELAHHVGYLIADQGEVDIPALIKAEKLPFKTYLAERLIEATRRKSLSTGLQYRITADRTANRIFISLFDAGATEPSTDVTVPVPGLDQDPQLEEYCREVIRAVLGPTRQRTNLRTSANRILPEHNTTIMSEPTHTQLRQTAVRNIELVLHWPNRRKLSLSLGTENEEEARRRSGFIRTWIREAIDAGQTTTINEIRNKMREFAGADPVLGQREASRNDPLILGPLLIGVDRGDGHHEPKLKCYVHLTGNPGKGYRLIVDLALPTGSARDRLATERVVVESALGCSQEQMATLRLQLRHFLQTRFAAFFSAGGLFPDVHDIAEGPEGKRGLTPRAKKKLDQILENRLDTAFVRRALADGSHSPFDLQLPLKTINRHSATPFYPQPAHPEIRFENCREKSLPGDGLVIACSVVWRGQDGRERFRRDVTVAYQQLAELAVAIDRWTGDARRQTEDSLPFQTTLHLLRQATANIRPHEFRL